MLGGTLRWIEYKNDELVYFGNTSELNSPVTSRNIKFTLQDRYEPQPGRHIYYSTAVGSKITENHRIGCSDGKTAKYCNISVIGKCTQYSKAKNLRLCMGTSIASITIYIIACI